MSDGQEPISNLFRVKRNRVIRTESRAGLSVWDCCLDIPHLAKWSIYGERRLSKFPFAVVASWTAAAHLGPKNLFQHSLHPGFPTGGICTVIR